MRGKIYLLEDSPPDLLVEPTAPAQATELIRDAYEALGQGELEPLVALMDDDVEWRGRRSGIRFWRPPPS